MLALCCNYNRQWKNYSDKFIMAMEEKWSVDKLDGTNWMTLKFQVCHLLLAKGSGDMLMVPKC